MSEQRLEIEAFERRILTIFAAAGLLAMTSCGDDQVAGTRGSAGEDGGETRGESGTGKTTGVDATSAGTAIADASASTDASAGESASADESTTALATGSSITADDGAGTAAGSETGKLCDCADGEVCVAECDIGGFWGVTCVASTCTQCTPECQRMLCGYMGSCEAGCSGGGAPIGCADFGRPYLVDGTTVVASLAERSDWLAPLSAIAAAGDTVRVHDHTDQALAEHASIASFAQLVLDLLALAAPAELVHAAALAMADEVEHARLAFALASARVGRPLGPGALLQRPSRPATKIELATETASAAVHETIGAFAQRAAAHAQTDAERARVHHRIADDELRHAELGWRIVAWAIQDDSAARAAVALTLAGWREPSSWCTDDASSPVVDALAGLLRRTGVALARWASDGERDAARLVWSRTRA